MAVFPSSTPHLLDTQFLSKDEIDRILQRAAFWEKKGYDSSLYKGRFIANLFFEPSTRTRFSFEVAQKRLGLHVISIAPELSSIEKGETLYDTIKTLSSVGVEVAVIRHRDSEELFSLISKDVGCRIINAGAGKEAHPTQALLDLYTMKKHFGDLNGKKVVMIGDIAHSRVVRSNLAILSLYGAEVYLSGPEEMRDKECERQAPYLPFEEALSMADVVMMLRVQLERHKNSLFTSAEEYHRHFGLNRDRLKLMKPEAIIMHPAPVNRGVEISDEMVEHPRSKIFEQMKNGVFVRMAVIEWALGGI